MCVLGAEGLGSLGLGIRVENLLFPKSCNKGLQIPSLSFGLRLPGLDSFGDSFKTSGVPPRALHKGLGFAEV